MLHAVYKMFLDDKNYATHEPFSNLYSSVCVMIAY